MRDKLARRRYFIWLGFLGLLILLLIGYLLGLMVFTVDQGPRQTKLKLPVERGLILDRNGEELALQPELYSAEAWLPHLENPAETAKLLAEVLGQNPSTILQKLNVSSNAVVIQHQLNPTEASRIEALQKEGKLKGIYLKPKPGRIYPQQELACHVIGYVNVDNVGLAGIEYSFNDDLSPPTDLTKETTYGHQVVLTIDIKLQYYLDKLALAAYDNTKADAVMILVMEAKTGEILAYTSIPRFDPNTFSKYSDLQRMNRPLQIAYEPGSVMKIFTIAAMLEKKAISPQDQFICRGSYEYLSPRGDQISIKCMGSHGPVNAQTIIKYSCNAGAAYASEHITANSFYEMLRSFGFGQKTGIYLSGESAGILAPPANWSLRSKPTIAFGQEISTTALQIVTAATVFANNGILLRPQLVKRVITADGKTVLKSFGREGVRQVLSAETAQMMLTFMETATEPNGCAYLAHVEGIRIAAKTGTAQVIDPQTGSYSNKDYIASILGLFPVEDPRIILYVVVQNPKEGSYWGSRVAAPLFKKAAEEIIYYLDIPREGETTFLQPKTSKLPLPPTLSLGSQMPDLRGLPKRSLYPLLALGLEVVLDGEGYVVEQSPSPGTRLQKNTKIYLRLE